MTWKPKDSYCSVNTCLCPVCGNDITSETFKTIFYKYETVCNSCGTKLEVLEERKMYYHVQKCEIGI